MKKVTLIAAFCALLMGSITTPAAAQDCGSNWGDCCEWSMCDGKVKFGAEWLYWKTQQDNMAVAGVSEINVETPNFFDACVEEPKFKFTSGFRVNLGYELPCNCWEANVIYTYVPVQSNKRHLVATDTQEILTLEDADLIPGFVDNIQELSQRWDLTINNIDVDIARTITFNECISIRPHAGFRTLWYTEKQRVAAVVDDFYGTGEDEFNHLSSLGKNKFRGYGVEAGLWGSWQIGCGFSLIGHFGGSILYSKFDVTKFYDLTFVAEGEETIDVESAKICHSIRTATPTMDYFLGLQFADQMCDMSFAIRAGWEQHILFDTNRIFGNGNLSTQGLTLGLEVGF